MNQTIKSNLRDALVTTIDSYSPEYVWQSEECDTYISGLVDSIERFEDECEKDLNDRTDTQNWLDKEQGKP